MLVINERIKIPLSEFEFDYVRSQGPGGQNVNKVNTKAIVFWNVTASPSIPDDVKGRFTRKFHQRMAKDGRLIVRSQRFRDQKRNAADCLEKVRKLVLAVADRPTVRKKTKPTAASKARRLRDKRHTSQKKSLRSSPGNDQ